VNVTRWRRPRVLVPGAAVQQVLAGADPVLDAALSYGR